MTTLHYITELPGLESDMLSYDWGGACSIPLVIVVVIIVVVVVVVLLLLIIVVIVVVVIELIDKQLSI